MRWKLPAAAHYIQNSCTTSHVQTISILHLLICYVSQIPLNVSDSRQAGVTEEIVLDMQFAFACHICAAPCNEMKYVCSSRPCTTALSLSLFPRTSLFKRQRRMWSKRCQMWQKTRSAQLSVWAFIGRQQAKGCAGPDLVTATFVPSYLPYSCIFGSEHASLLHISVLTRSLKPEIWTITTTMQMIRLHLQTRLSLGCCTQWMITVSDK